MELVTFKVDEVHKDGLPQVCLCCGNDDPPDLVLTHRATYKSLPVTIKFLSILLLLLAPPIWIAGFMISMFIAGSAKIPFSVPICNQCLEGQKHSRLIFSVVFVIGFLTVLASLTLDTRSYLAGLGIDVWLELAVIIYLLLLLDTKFCSSKFYPQLVNKSKDQVTLGVYWDEYPGVHQYFRDNIALYGSTNGFAQEQEDLIPGS